MFESEEDYITGALDQFGGLVQHRSQPFFEKRTENILSIGSAGGLFCHVPQDYNFDVEVNGSVLGVNPGDSKLLGNQARLVTTGKDSTVRVRRLRTDECFVKTVNGSVTVDSYIEAQRLHIQTQRGPI